ncbi:ACP phosphodiesterase [Dysgonomonas sp. 511]|uniref:acyl carrier protein phosphodiesterase n=1 Tax=Dysgonomonas sp. 511 TaxID=2302930 RepID=UPI0013D1974B|nr:ACP phosphodiesterase [Dysgonomonas sp. 511]NDV79050.1 DUF479 domain-containing protein [Dysgonomonas sp. 511]
MNFLAHAYLSFSNSAILAGNMVADMVKGKQMEAYPPDIQQGIYIHRQIDSFTDNYPINQMAMNIFRPSAGKYAGAFLDVSYDHFLALSEKFEPENGWEDFTQLCYRQIGQHSEILPSKFCSMFVYMESEDWLYNYRHKWLIEKSFYRLKQRAKYLTDDAPVFEAFEENYEELSKSFDLFFPELYKHVKDMIANGNP